MHALLAYLMLRPKANEVVQGFSQVALIGGKPPTPDD
jgi:hypothetical protein